MLWIQSLISMDWESTMLHTPEALRMIGCFEEQGIPVLGGDVFLLKDNIPSLTYDNWYCDKNPQESDQEYVIRSCRKAYEYVSSYNSDDSNKALFSLVH